MLKTIRNISYISYISGANRMNRVLQKAPGFGKNVPDLVHKNSGTRRMMIIVSAIVAYIREFVKKSAYVAVVMFLPWKLFSAFMPEAWAGFTIENSFVYFALIMSCICGSVNNCKIFQPSDEAYVMLRELRCRPADYYRYVIVRRAALELTAFWPAFTVFGLAASKAFYLALIVTVSRFVGDAVNILVFRACGKSVDMIKGVSVVIMLLSLFVAYFMPYVNGRVPHAYTNVFNTLFFMILLAVVSVFMYYVWNYGKYDRIAVIVCAGDDEDDDNGDRCETLDSEDVRNTYEQLSESKTGCYERINRLFLSDNREYITGRIAVRIIIIAVAFVGMMCLAVTGHENLACRLLVYSAPILVFVMCIMSQSSFLCERMFEQWDSHLLSDSRYIRANDRLENFIVRLKYLVLVDLIPAAFLAAAYGGLGIIIGKPGSAGNILLLVAEILILSCFFSIYNMTIYYMIQPFKAGEGSGLKKADVIRLVTYVLCALLVYTNVTVAWYIVVSGLATGIMAAAVVTLVWKCGDKTFKIK